MDRERVKPLAACESPPSGGLSLVEPGDGLIAQLWLESAERLAGPAAEPSARDAAPTLAGMVLSSRGQRREETPHAGSGNVLCAVVAALVLAW